MAIQLYRLTELQNLQLLPKKELNFFREISGQWKLHPLEVLCTHARSFAVTLWEPDGRCRRPGKEAVVVAGFSKTGTPDTATVKS